MKGDMKMKFFTNLIKFVKKTVQVIKDFFKDKNPIEVVNDTAKTVAAVATAAIAIYTGINAIRVHLIPAMKKNVSSDNKSAHDYLIEDRNSGSIDHKIYSVRKNASRLNKKSAPKMKKEEMEALAEIAKTRNSIFQSLSPEEQLNILEMEEFDFKEYVSERKKSKSFRFSIFKNFDKFGKTDDSKPFREPVDYGFFNFIMRPLDDFVHWIKNDPVPKKVPQIQIVEHPEIPDVNCENPADLVRAARNLDSYLSRNSHVADEFGVSSQASLEEQQILAEEIFRHKTLSKFKKAVNRRMAHSEYNTPNLFELMADDGKKKKKKKKHHDEDVADDVKKKKKKKNKDESKAESDADKRAQALYRYHLEKAMNGEVDRKGYF